VFPVEPPGNHVYVLAPLPVSVAELVIQIFVAVAEMLSEGKAFTVTLTADVDVQPARVCPVTVYDTEDVGVTATLEPVRPPGFQV
jgi:hypothetical protein